jgi:hypothetical protein
VSLNFGRLHAYRPGYGYPGVNDPGAGEEASEDDGLYRIDLETGASRLIVSLAQCRQFEPDPTMDATPHWFNHAMVSPGGTRIMFLHRWRAEPNWHTRLFTCDPDGGNLCLLNPGPGISHCDWRDETVIVSWCQYGSDDLHYYLLTDRTQDASILGEALFCSDGHCCFCPDAGKRWLVTDTYPDAERMQTLILYDMCSNTRHDIGRYRVPPAVPVDIRCDLHPRWGRQETLLSFDGFHEPYRGVYVSHVPQLTGHSTESPGE